MCNNLTSCLTSLLFISFSCWHILQFHPQFQKLIPLLSQLILFASFAIILLCAIFYDFAFLSTASVPLPVHISLKLLTLNALLPVISFFRNLCDKLNWACLCGNRKKWTSVREYGKKFLGAAQTLLNQTVPVHLADGGDCCKLCLCNCRCSCCRCNFSLLPQQLCRNITERRWRRRQPKPAAISWQQIRRAQCIRCRRWAGNLTVAACHPFCLLPLLLLLP